MKKKILGVAALFCVGGQVWAADSRHIEVLAASCAACHGTNGRSIGGTPVLAGLEKSHFIKQMQSFRDGSRSSTVMHHHAKGLSSDEIERLADYFSAQPRSTGTAAASSGTM